MLMNLRQVEAFHAVMCHGTASRAAEVMRVSQPAVSKAVQDLERSIGFALFERAKGRLVPTPEARLFLREVEHAFLGLGRLRGAAARIRDLGSGEIRIATLSALSTTVLPKALRAFRARRPNVAVTVQAPMSATVRDLVATGQFDLGLAADEVDATGVDARPFATFRAVVALPSGHRLADRSVVEPGDLDGEPFIALAPEDTTRRQADEVFAKAGARPRVMIETPYSTTVCAMVAQGLGVGLVNRLTAAPYEGEGIVVRPFSAAVHFRTLLLLPTSRPPSHIVADLVEELLRFAVFEN